MGQRLSDTEALLWSLGRDPNLASTMGLVAMLDGRPDPERFRAVTARMVAAVDRLQQRVEEPGGIGGGTPEWTVDTHFDLDHHLRFIRLGTTGVASEAALRRAAVHFINDPFEATRPLWQFLVVSGLARGRSALVAKFHHSISDGLGLLELAGHLLDFEADAPDPDPVDLAAAFEATARAEAEADAAADAGVADGDRGRSWLQTLANPLQAGADAVASARAVATQLPRSEASALWSTRSRNRRLEFVSVPLADLRGRAEARDVTINDLFVTAAAQAAVHYHDRLGVALPTISATVVVSTGGPNEEGGGMAENAFIPVAIEIPGDGATIDERLAVVGAEVRARRAALEDRGNVLDVVSAIGGLMPRGLSAALLTDQAAKVDFATSNIPGTPIPTWLAGLPVTAVYPVGPVGGTAFNVTLMTGPDQALLGVHLDPAAISDPALLTSGLERGFRDLGL